MHNLFSNSNNLRETIPNLNQESAVRAITDALDSDRITMDDIAVATSVARNEP